jgi:hypothetical protein
MSSVRIDPEDGARISAALVKALAEGKTLADAGEIGPALRDLIQHARELCDLLLELLIATEPDSAEYVRGISDVMGNKLDELEALTTLEVDRPPPH